MCLEGIGVASEIAAISGATSGVEDEVARATAADGLAAGKAAVRGDVVGGVATGGIVTFDAVAEGAAAGSVTASEVTTGIVAALGAAACEIVAVGIAVCLYDTCVSARRLFESLSGALRLGAMGCLTPPNTCLGRMAMGLGEVGEVASEVMSEGTAVSITAGLASDVMSSSSIS